MDRMDQEFDLLVEDPASMYCEECSGRMQNMGSGRFVCTECGWEHLSDFGIVKKYLAENGPRNAMEVSRDTGVNLPTIQRLLREGRLEALDGETEYQLWSSKTEER